MSDAATVSLCDKIVAKQIPSTPVCVRAGGRAHVTRARVTRELARGWPRRGGRACVAALSRRLPQSTRRCLNDITPPHHTPAGCRYEDELCYAFRDISPCAPTHVLLVPKHRDGLSQLQLAEERHKALLGHLMWAAARVAKQEGLQEGYRVVINDGPAGCQSV